MSRCLFLLLASVLAIASICSAGQSNALFAFHSNPWLNLFQRVTQAASEQKVSVPPQLWHAVLFYTAGELTTRELKAHGIAYAQYAGPGLYTNLCGAGCREKIAEYWTPRIDGKQSVANALSALVVSFK